MFFFSTARSRSTGVPNPSRSLFLCLPCNQTFYIQTVQQACFVHNRPLTIVILPSVFIEKKDPPQKQKKGFDRKHKCRKIPAAAKFKPSSHHLKLLHLFRSRLYFLSTSSSHLTVTAPQINVGNDGDHDHHLQGQDVRKKLSA